MKKNILFLLFLAALSAVSGYLMSQMSWIGRIGINLMHREYQFLKVWWQGAGLVYVALLTLFVIHSVLHKFLNVYFAKLVHLLFLFGAILGVYFTYTDFTTDITHSLLKQRFHIGAYLFWAGWVLICFFFLFTGKKNSNKIIIQDNKAQASQ